MGHTTNVNAADGFVLSARERTLQCLRRHIG